MKPNWKKKYEETSGLLKLARDGNELLTEEINGWKRTADARQKALMLRPTLEKIVEKEALPVFVMPMFCALTLLFVVLSWLASHQIHQLQTPILSPYPVYIAKYIPPDPYVLGTCKDALADCQADYHKMKKKGCRP